MNKEFKCPPPLAAPDGWEYSGEVRPITYGEAGRPVHNMCAQAVYSWKHRASSDWYYWVLVPTYPKSVDILGVTVTVEDVYGTMDPAIPEGWKVKSFSVPTKDDLSVTVLHPIGGGIATLENFPSYLPSKHHKRMVIATPLLFLERIA